MTTNDRWCMLSGRTMTPVSRVRHTDPMSSEKCTLSALRALFDTGAPLAPLRRRRSDSNYPVDGRRFARLCDQYVARHFGHVVGAGERQADRQLLADDVERQRDAGLAARRERV